MLFSQIALIALIIIGIIARYIPVWLGIAALGAWAVAKLIMRAIITQVERSELRSQRLRARFDINTIERLHTEPDSSVYSCDLTIKPTDKEVDWRPEGLVLFQIDEESHPQCEITKYEVWHEDGFVDSNGAFRNGTHRVRLSVQTPASVRALVLAYGQERLGSMDLPNN